MVRKTRRGGKRTRRGGKRTRRGGMNTDNAYFLKEMNTVVDQANKTWADVEEESIKNSIINLFSFPYVKKAVEDRRLSIHGLIHNIATGGIKFLNPITEDFENL